MSTHRTSNFDWHGDDQHQSCSHVGRPFVGLRGEVHLFAGGAEWAVLDAQAVALSPSATGEARVEAPVASGHTHTLVDAMACVEEFILGRVEDARQAD